MTSSNTATESPTWEQRLTHLMPEVHEMRERLKNPPPTEAGSFFAEYDNSALQIKTSAWFSLCVSTDHLGLIYDSLTTHGFVSPTAYLTLARTAHSTAANVIWLLSPEEEKERIKRAASFRKDDLQKEKEFHREIPPGDHDQQRESRMTAIEENERELNEIGMEYKISRQEWRFRQTEAIKKASEYLDTENDPWLQTAFNLLWRSGSGAAHGQLHFALLRMDTTNIEESSDGTQLINLSGDFEGEIAPAIGGVFLTLKQAFDLFDERRKKPTPPNPLFIRK